MCCTYSGRESVGDGGPTERRQLQGDGVPREHDGVAHRAAVQVRVPTDRAGQEGHAYK